MTKEDQQGNEAASRNEGLALAKSAASAMRRLSVGENISNGATDRTVVTYISDFASITPSKAGARKKATPLAKR